MGLRSATTMLYNPWKHAVEDYCSMKRNPTHARRSSSTDHHEYILYTAQTDDSNED